MCGSRGVCTAWTLEETPFLRCEACRCVFAHPARASAAGRTCYAGDYHEARGHGSPGGGIERAKRTGFERLLALLGPPRPGARLLEIGCGAGDALAVASGLGWAAAGVDVSPRAVEAARRRFPALDVRVGSDEVSDFPDGSFDAVLLLDVIEHLGRPHELVASVRRVLREGGRVLVVTPDAESPSARLLGRRWFHALPEHVLLHSRESLRLLFEAHGLERTRQGFAWKNVSGEMLYRHARIHGHIFAGRLVRAVLGSLPEKARALVVPFNVGEFFAVFRKGP